MKLGQTALVTGLTLAMNVSLALAAGVTVPMSVIERVPPAQIATSIQGYMGDGSQNADLLATLAAVRGNIATAKNDDQSIAGWAFVSALENPEAFSSLESYLATAPNGAGAIAAMKPWHEKIQADAATRKSFKKAVEIMKKSIGFPDFGTLTDDAAPAAQAAPAVVVDETAGQKVIPQAQLKLAVKAKAAAKPAAGLAFGEEAKPAPLPVVSAKEKQMTFVRQYIDALVRLDPEDPLQRQQGRGAARTYGMKTQKDIAAQSLVLNAPLAKISRSRQGDDVQQAIDSLNSQLDKLDPSKVDFNPAAWRKVLAKLHIKELPAQRYSADFPAAQKAIKGIMTAMEHARDERLEDNKRLLQMQSHFIKLSKELKEKIEFAKLVDAELESRLSEEGGIPEERRLFLTKEWLEPLRKRLMDLQSMQILNTQNIVASGMVIESNETLAGDVDRAITLLPAALQTSVEFSIALGYQRNTIRDVSAVSKATMDRMKQNTSDISKQMLEIEKQSQEGVIPTEALVGMITQLREVASKVENYRNDALPKMLEEIKKRDEAMRQGGELAAKMDKDLSAAQKEAAAKKK